MNVTGAGWAGFFARVTVGLQFFMAGVFKVFGMGPTTHALTLFVEPFSHTWLPPWLLWLAGSAIPFVELVGGALCIVGLFRRPALVALGFTLLTVTYGHLLEEPLRSTADHIFPRLMLVIAALVLCGRGDGLALDRLLHLKRGEGQPR